MYPRKLVRQSARTRVGSRVADPSSQAPVPTHSFGPASRSGPVSSVGPIRSNKRTHSEATARVEPANIFPPLQLPSDLDDLSDVCSILSPANHTSPCSPGHMRPSSPYHSLSFDSVGYDTASQNLIPDDDSFSSDFSSPLSSPSLSPVTLSTDTPHIPPFTLFKGHPESALDRFDHPESASWLRVGKDELPTPQTTQNSLFKSPWMHFDEQQVTANQVPSNIFSDVTVYRAMIPDGYFNTDTPSINHHALQMAPPPMAINFNEIQIPVAIQQVLSDEIKQQPAAFPFPPPLPPVLVEVAPGPRIAIAPQDPSPSQPCQVDSFHARAEGDAEGFRRLNNVPAHSIAHKDARHSSNHLTFREESRKVVLHVLHDLAVDHLNNGGTFHIRARLPSGPISRPATAKLQNQHVVLYVPKVPVTMCPEVSVPGADSTCHEIEIVFGEYYFTFPATVRTRAYRKRAKKVKTISRSTDSDQD